MFNNIPLVMRPYPQWVCWRYEINPDNPDGKPKKVPYDPKTGWKADVTNSNTWASLEVATSQTFGCDEPVDGALHPDQTGYSGIGFVLTTNDPFGFIDLDDHNNDPVAAERQMEIYSTFNSYSERSPSGKGLHIIIEGQIPKGRRKSFVEVYSDARYMTMTGDIYRDTPITNYQTEFNQLWEQMGKGLALSYYDGNIPQYDTDEEVIRRACDASNGEKFKKLLVGDWKDDYESHSQADMAFFDILAFYTQNIAQLRRMFLASPLGQRDKAHTHKRYIKYMIEKSFDRMLPPVDIEGLSNQMELQLDEERARRRAGNVELKAGRPIKEEQPTLPGIPDIAKPLHLSDLPPGLLGEIALYAYHSSPRPVPEVALAAAIGLMGGICGRSYNISRTGLNQYTLLLAQTGIGKEGLQGAIARLMTNIKTRIPFASQFEGPSFIPSGQGLIRHIAKTSKCFVSVIGEVAIMLEQISGKYASNNQLMLKKVLLELYQKSGHGDVFGTSSYADTEKSLPTIPSPAFSLLGESVPEKFYRILDEDMISEGFLPRFTIIEYTGRRPRLNENHAKHAIPFDLSDKLASLTANALQLEGGNKVLDVQMNEEAYQFQRDFDEFCDHQINSSDTEVQRQLWNRAHLKMLKLAALVAVGCDFFHPTIELAHMKWAHSLVVHDVFRIMSKYQKGEVGINNEESEQQKKLKSVCLEYLTSDFNKVSSYLVPKDMFEARVIPWGYISRRLTSQPVFKKDKFGVTGSLRRTLQSLIDAGILREIPASQLKELYNTSQKAYSVANFDALKPE